MRIIAIAIVIIIKVERRNVKNRRIENVLSNRDLLTIRIIDRVATLGNLSVLVKEVLIGQVGKVMMVVISQEIIIEEQRVVNHTQIGR